MTVFIGLQARCAMKMQRGHKIVPPYRLQSALQEFRLTAEEIPDIFTPNTSPGFSDPNTVSPPS
jgi:hypothetical protein